MITKQALDDLGISVRQAAKEMGIAHSTLRGVLQGNYPKSKEKELKQKVKAFCKAHNIERSATQKEATTSLGPLGSLGDDDMLIRKQGLDINARRAFGLTFDPFGEVHDRKQVWLSSEIRYVRETMLHVAVNGGFLAVVGESGSGKSTLRKDLHERLAEEHPHVIPIYPQMLGSEDSDKRGTMLRAGHIMDAILSTLATGVRIPQSPEMRARKVVETLKQSSKSGFRHVLIIEEAHGLNRHTIKHLKRFFELEDGFKRLLSIIMIGQQELKYEKLRENDVTTREVVQRCEVVELQPLIDVDGYIRHRLSLASGGDTAFWEKDASQAIEHVLTSNGKRQTYPLIVGNLANRALSLAASTGEAIINREVILGM